MRLVALDVKGTGGHERDLEAILEIALVPITDWRPDLSLAFSTLLNPERPIPRTSWIAPGLTDVAVRSAPRLRDIQPCLDRQVNGQYLVGYDLAAQWPLLRRCCPGLAPAGLIDTLRLARIIDPGQRNDLSSVIKQLRLTAEVDDLAVSLPGRALWDAVAAALLLGALAVPALGPEVGVEELLSVAGIPADRRDRRLMRTPIPVPIRRGDVRAIAAARWF
jgi:DNA polymerase-3 subunit epsilon